MNTFPCSWIRVITVTVLLFVFMIACGKGNPVRALAQTADESHNPLTKRVGSRTLMVFVTSVPIAQSVAAGTRGFLAARFVLDGTALKEDVKIFSFAAVLNASGSVLEITNVRLFDGRTTLTSGNATVNPTQAGLQNFRFSRPVVLSRGTTKALDLRLDLSVGAGGLRFQWGLDESAERAIRVVETRLRRSVKVTVYPGPGQEMTVVSNGRFSVVLDASSPSYQIVEAGASNVELARLKFSGSVEDIDLRKIALQLSGVIRNTPVDLLGREVSLFDAFSGQKIADVQFAAGDYAVSGLIAPRAFRIPRDGSRIMIVKGNIAAISPAGPLVTSGDLLKVDYDGDNRGLNGTYGVGIASGNVISPDGGDTQTPGVRIMRAYPSFVYIPLTFAERTLVPGITADKTLYKFSAQAVGSDIEIYKFTFPLTVSGVALSNFELSAYTDATFSNRDFAQPVFMISAGGGPGELEIAAYGVYTIAAGQTRYFRFASTVADVGFGESVIVRLAGDAAPPASSFMGTAGEIDGDQHNDFIWSPVSVLAEVLPGDPDWTNGYLLPGLPISYMTATTLTP